MPDNISLSPEARVDCNGLPINTLSGSRRVQRDLVPKTGTEDTSSRIKASPLRKATIQLTIQREPDAGYHTPGVFDLLAPGGAWIRIWHNGRGDPSNVDDFPSVVFGEEGDAWNMANSSAQELTFQGETDGDFFLAQEP